MPVRHTCNVLEGEAADEDYSTEHRAGGVLGICVLRVVISQNLDCDKMYLEA